MLRLILASGPDFLHQSKDAFGATLSAPSWPHLLVVKLSLSMHDRNDITACEQRTSCEIQPELMNVFMTAISLDIFTSTLLSTALMNKQQTSQASQASDCSYVTK